MSEESFENCCRTTAGTPPRGMAAQRPSILASTQLRSVQGAGLTSPRMSHRALFLPLGVPRAGPHYVRRHGAFARQELNHAPPQLRPVVLPTRSCWRDVAPV